MSETLPNTVPLKRLWLLIHYQEERIRQVATLVRISRTVASDLMSMTATDWYASGDGTADMAECELIADAFQRDGIAAANGLRLAPYGPVLEVAEGPHAPEVHILHGVPYAEPE